MPEGSLPSLSTSSADRPKRPTPPSIPAGRPPIPARPPGRPTPPSIPAGGPPVRPVSQPLPKSTPAPQPPTPVVTSLQREAESALAAPEVVIRTMQDDLREARGGAAAPVKAAAAPRPSMAKPVASVRPGSLPTAQGNTPLVPLPPKTSTGPQKVVMAPPIKRRHRSRTAGVLLLFIFIILIGGGAFAWLRFGDQLQDTFLGSGGEAVPAAQVLPAGSALILQYEVSSAEERGQLISAWNTGDRGDPSVTSLLEGDPRLLLLEADVTAFYYVFLEDEARPYVVVRKSRRLQELFEGNPDARTADVQGWYVVSSVSTGGYTTALAAGPLAQLGDDVFVNPATPAPLRVFLGPHALITLRETLLGTELANGLLQEISLAGRWRGTQALEVNGQGTGLSSGGEASDGTRPINQANQQLLSLIPEEATLVRLGGNFYQDLSVWGGKSGALDMAVLQQTTVAAFMQQLTGSYAFYSTSPNPAAHDIGVIISLPVALRGQTVVPNQNVEDALSALLPLLTGRKGIAPIQFTTFSHAGVPLRYANFSQPSQALDYAVFDLAADPSTGGADSYLMIASSRESMFAQLETAKGTHTAIDASARWQSLLSTWGALPVTANLILGSLDVPQLAALLPVADGTVPLFGVAAGSQSGPGADIAGDSATSAPTQATTAISGVVVLPQ